MRGLKDESKPAVTEVGSQNRQIIYDKYERLSDFTNGAFHRPVYGTKAYYEWKEKQNGRAESKQSNREDNS